MGMHSPTIQRFVDAWLRGDDDAINRITIEVNERGDDAEIVVLARAMAANPYGEGA
ncbi:hypothetical protein ACWCPF_25895 [Streptomyces sp. NPDC001858]